MYYMLFESNFYLYYIASSNSLLKYYLTSIDRPEIDA